MVWLLIFLLFSPVLRPMATALNEEVELTEHNSMYPTIKVKSIEEGQAYYDRYRGKVNIVLRSSSDGIKKLFREVTIAVLEQTFNEEPNHNFGNPEFKFFPCIDRILEEYKRKRKIDSGA